MGEKLQHPRYSTDLDGYVDWVSVSHGEFNRDMYATSPYINGREADGYPKLGTGLRVKGDERDYPHSASIHIEDIHEFADRVKVFELLRDGYRCDDEEKLVPLTQNEIDSAIEKLSSFGLSKEEVITATLTNRRVSMRYSFLNMSFVFGQG